MAEAADALVTEVDGGVALLTLSRPDRLNAMDRGMEHALVDELDRLDRDDAVRVVVVTGAGRAFCAGADLSGGQGTFDVTRDAELRARAGSIAGVPRDGGGLVALQIVSMRTPVIGAINGAAVGLGATITLPMDVRIAADSARFGFVFAKRGIVMEAASSWFLPRVVGISRALEWVLTARMVSAAEALQGGLVSKVVPDGEVVAATMALAHEMASVSPVSAAVSRQLLWAMTSASSPWDAHRYESALLAELGRGPDAAEGVSAFLERRSADFTGSAWTDYPEVVPPWPPTPDDVRAHEEIS